MKVQQASTVRAEAEIALEPAAAFEILIEELTSGLSELGYEFTPAADGELKDGATSLARVIEWQPPSRVRLAWHSTTSNDRASEMILTCERLGKGSRVAIEQHGWAGALDENNEDVVGWFARQVAAPLMRSLSASSLADWIMDRRVRRPSGRGSRHLWKDPHRHKPSFRAVLDALALRSDDRLIDIGCGGGALLELALKSGCRAVGVDHSPDMVRAATELNTEAVRAGRLEVVQGRADHLAFPDGCFTCATMTGVFAFLTEPVAALREVRRVLRPGGRFVLFVGSADLRDSRSFPEEVASRLFLYDDADLGRLARDAGLDEVRVTRPDLLDLAVAAGLPESEITRFASRSWQLLTAQRSK